MLPLTLLFLRALPFPLPLLAFAGPFLGPPLAPLVAYWSSLPPPACELALLGVVGLVVAAAGRAASQAKRDHLGMLTLK
jgi:hypothetical protein